jgi:hypothetical protein
MAIHYVVADKFELFFFKKKMNFIYIIGLPLILAPDRDQLKHINTSPTLIKVPTLYKKRQKKASTSVYIKK